MNNVLRKDDREEQFLSFQKRIEEEVLSHQVIVHNPYTEWFRAANLSLEEVRNFTVQFSVFSNNFLIAQLKKMINAQSLEAMRASKEILANEIGVIFHSKHKQRKEGEVFQTEGSIDGGTFLFKAGHFEWLLNFAAPLGLKFQDLGKRRLGSDSTLFFMDALEELYGSDDYSIAAGASFAVEHWAAKGFWKDLIGGLSQFKETSGLPLNLGFFIWHDKVEDQHAEHTEEEVKEAFFSSEIPLDEEKFIWAAQKMLDAVFIFWNGLYENRIVKN